LAVAAASMVAFAQPPQNLGSAPTPVPVSPTPVPVTPTSVPLAKKESVQIPASASVVRAPLLFLAKPLVKHKVWSVDGMSSRPWGQIVGIHPGYSAFPAPELRDPEMDVIWVGRDPR
jgi:hypothetical protein